MEQSTEQALFPVALQICIQLFAQMAQHRQAQQDSRNNDRLFSARRIKSLRIPRYRAINYTAASQRKKHQKQRMTHLRGRHEQDHWDSSADPPADPEQRVFFHLLSSSYVWDEGLIHAALKESNDHFMTIRISVYLEVEIGVLLRQYKRHYRIPKSRHYGILSLIIIIQTNVIQRFSSCINIILCQ